MLIRNLLRAQDGVVSREQALHSGLSPSMIRRRVARGEWEDVHPGVLHDTTHAPCGDTTIRAAWLWVGEDGLVSGPAAASWLGMPAPVPDLVEITVANSVRRRAPSGIRLRRRLIPVEDRMWHRGVLVTAHALTVLETCATIPDGAAFLDRALQRRWTTPRRLHAAYCRNAGAHGMAAAHTLLVAALDRADSALERRLLRLLRAAGLTRFVRGLPLGGGREIDIAFPAERVAIELDGWAWHVDPARFAADRTKGNDLVAAGWTVLRFTWHDVTEEPDLTIARIRRALGE